jgi:type IV secretion system protein VirB10
MNPMAFSEEPEADALFGCAGIVILAAVFSGVGKKSSATKAAANHEPPQPAVQDNTDNNVQT